MQGVNFNEVCTDLGELKYYIIGSGSSGNCVRVDDMMFDVGLSYKQIRPYLYGVNYIFVTHKHSDHYKASTVNQIKKDFPRIKWIGNWDLSLYFHCDFVVGDKTKIELQDRQIESFKCIHDVVNHGFIVTFENYNFIYVTDTATLEYAPIREYTHLFLESNHDEKKIEQVRDKGRSQYGYDVWANAKRHLSTQKSKAFYYINRKDKNSKWIELHKSGRFY